MYEEKRNMYRNPLVPQNAPWALELIVQKAIDAFRFGAVTRTSVTQIHLTLCSRPCCFGKPANMREVGIGVVVNSVLWCWYNAFELYAPQINSSVSISDQQYNLLVLIRDKVEYGDQQ